MPAVPEPAAADRPAPPPRSTAGAKAAASKPAAPPPATACEPELGTALRLAWISRNR